MTDQPGTRPPRARGRRGRAADRALGRLLRLPPATCEYRVTGGVRIPMRDGVELLARHYAPATASPRGTVLVRGPYGRSSFNAAFFARPYAERGFHVVLQSCRGTFGSGDVFTPMVREAADGADTVAWLRSQPWFTGRFATLGGSYLGFTQWALLTDPPDELAAAVIMVAPHDFGRAVYATGAFALNDFLSWSELVAHQEDVGPARGLLRRVSAARRLRPAFDGLPLGEAGEAVLGGRAPWYRDWLAHPDPGDPYWADARADAALDRVRAPVLLVGGWHDPFLDQTIEQYVRLRARGVDVALTVGPWVHRDILLRGSPVVTRESLAWLGAHLAGDTSRARSAPVRLYVTGARRWRDLPDWPAGDRDRVSLFLQPGGRLGSRPPAPDAPPSTFTYDPADATPTVGGRLMSLAAGSRDNRPLEARGDVLTFTGPALAADVEVVGTPVVELVHGSSNPHADVFVRLCEVDAKGRSRNVSDALVRLDPGQTSSVVRLDLDPLAHRFRAGTRIRLQVSGGSHPRFARNLGTAEPPPTARHMALSHRTVAHGAGGTSRLSLPVSAGRLV